MFMANPICFRLETHLTVLALSREPISAGSSMEARMAMIAMTTRSSIRVKNTPEETSWNTALPSRDGLTFSERT